MTHCPHCHKSLTEKSSTEILQAQWFEEFWPLMWRRYPQAQPKEPARRAYARVIKTEADHQLAMAAARREAPIQGAKEGRFRIMAATWLNQMRWKDEMEVVESVTRVIECAECGDSGLVRWESLMGHSDSFARCSCSRGSLPGLVIPSVDDSFPNPASGD